MEAVLGQGNSYEEAAAIAQGIEIRNQAFDFEKVYNLYPRKKGKSAGLRWLKRHVRSSSRFDLVMEAVQNFANECNNRGTDENFIPYFSSWCPQFEDYINETGGGVATKPSWRTEPMVLQPHDIERLLLGDE
jgi:hypothetical protein